MAAEILLVGDEPALLEGCRRLPHAQVSVDTGQGAQVAQEMPSVIVSGMRMPSGSAACGQKRQEFDRKEENRG